MKHVKTLNSSTLKESMKKGGCGECQTSCQSACKTSCTVGNQIVCRNMRQMSEKDPYGRKDGRGYFACLPKTRLWR